MSADPGAYFYRDLERFNTALQELGAVVADPGGFDYIDPAKVPADLLRAYRRLVTYGAANGLL